MAGAKKSLRGPIGSIVGVGMLAWLETDAVLTTVLVAAVLGVAGVASWLVHRWLRAVEERRRNRLGGIEHFDALESPGELGPSHEEQRAEALTSVRNRFSIFRRALIAAVLVVGMTIAFLPMLSTVPATMISVLAGVLSVIIGMAARPFIENFISGLVLSLSNRIHVGDTVFIDGKLGSIEDVTPTHTVIKLWDWQRYILPNSRMLNKELYCLSNKDSNLWAWTEFVVAYEADLAVVKVLAVEAAKAVPDWLEVEEPEMWVMGLEPEGVRCWLAAWVRGPEALWNMRVGMRAGLVEAFRQHGIPTHLHRWRDGFQAHRPDPLVQQMTDPSGVSPA